MRPLLTAREAGKGVSWLGIYHLEQSKDLRVRRRRSGY
jgi:hypothetical protein